MMCRRYGKMRFTDALPVYTSFAKIFE